jgi:hypothetical protein
MTLNGWRSGTGTAPRQDLQKTIGPLLSIVSSGATSSGAECLSRHELDLLLPGSQPSDSKYIKAGPGGETKPGARPGSGVVRDAPGAWVGVSPPGQSVLLPVRDKRQPQSDSGVAQAMSRTLSTAQLPENLNTY